MRIAHIAQTHGYHAVGHRPTTEEFDRVVVSQFAVAQLILQNPHCPVICESMDHNRTFREFNQGKSTTFGPYEINVKKIQKIFPRGLPDNFDDLNRPQKEALYCGGATTVLLFLNIIPILYSSIDEITGKMGQNFLANDIQIAHETKVETASFLQTAFLIQSIREKAAIEAIKYAAEAHYKKVKETSIAILVYGSMHDFQPLCTKNGLGYQKIYTHPLQVEKYGKNSRYESTYIPGSPYWSASDICDVSKLDVDKINKQSSVEFSPQKIKILSSLLLMTAGSGLLAMYFLLSVANPLVLLIFGILFVGIGLIVGLYLFADWLKDRYNPPPATIGVVIEGEEPASTIHKHTSLNTRQPTFGRGTLFSSVDDQLPPVSDTRFSATELAP